jgi:hypothetical protein
MVSAMHDVPRPRVLFESVPSDELYEELKRYAPTAGRFGDDVTEIHASDWDLVVSFHSAPEEPEGVNVLSFGGTSFRRRKLGPSRYPRLGWGVHARTVVRAQGCPAEFAALVDRTIVAAAPPPPRLAFGDRPLDYIDAIAVLGQEQAPFAGIITTGGVLTLALPEFVSSYAEWLVAFIDHLRPLQPARFPASPDWQVESSWATPAMRTSMRELDELTVERTAALQSLAAREAAIAAQLGAAAAAAAAGPHRVLTSDGPDLVAGVLELLSDLGFEAEDRDDHHDEKTGAKLEDLLVKDGGWTCLAEVKGYTKGAKVNEVPKITGRPSVAFAAEHGEPPDAVWHIVNTWRATDPATRPPAVPNDLDLVPLTGADGCLIDTRDMFRAWRDVREGRATADEVREAMRNAVTRWSWAPPPANR